MAQQIQRQLEEVELKQREVEKRGVVIERVLRGDGPGQSLSSSLAKFLPKRHFFHVFFRTESALLLKNQPFYLFRK